MTLLLVNPMNDFHANFFAFKLKQRSIPFIELGSLDSNDYTYVNGQLIYNGTVIENITSVYIRGNFMYLPPALETPYIDTYNEQTRFKSQIEMMLAWIKIMEQRGMRTLNSFVSYSKHLQLHLLIQAGLPIPKTCITNSLDVVEDFSQSVGEIVFKPLNGGYYCRKFSPEMMLDTETFNGEPAIFQEYIEGEDIRVYILDGEILSAHKIEKSDNTSSSIDYRTDTDFKEGEADYTIIELPDDVKKMCAQAASLSDLVFSGIDLKMTANGEFYLLECNSMPNYLDVEFKNGIKITDALIDFLTKGEEYLHPPQFIEATISTGHSNAEAIFNYKEVFKKHFESEKERDGMIILPLNEDQAKQFEEGVMDADGTPFMVVSVKDIE